MADVVLVTGVSRYLGGHFARRLTADPSVSRVIGVDVIPPPHDIGGAEFVRADIRNPMIGKIIAQAEVDTVVHMNVIATPTHAGGRTSAEGDQRHRHDAAARCVPEGAEHPPARREVLRRRLRLQPARPGDVHRGHGRQGAAPRPGSARTPSRSRATSGASPGAGPTPRSPCCASPTSSARGIRTSLTDYFSLPVVPVPFGYDARLQFVHEDDAHRARCCGPRPAERRHRQHRRGRRHHGAPGGRPSPAGRSLPVPLHGRRAARQRRQAARAGRLLAPTRCSSSPSAGAGHHPDARGARLRAAVHHPRGLRGLRSRHRARPCPAPRSPGLAVSGVAGTAAHAIGHVWASGRNALMAAPTPGSARRPGRGPRVGRSGPPRPKPLTAQPAPATAGADGRRRGRRARPRRARRRRCRPAPAATRAPAAKQRRGDRAAATPAPSTRASSRRLPSRRRGDAVRRGGARRRGSDDTPAAGPPAPDPRQRKPHRPHPVAKAVRASGRGQAGPARPAPRRRAPASAPQPRARPAAPARRARTAHRGRRTPRREPSRAAPPPSHAGLRCPASRTLLDAGVGVLRVGCRGRRARRPRTSSARSPQTLAFLRRRLTGDYAVDEFGFDEDLTEHVFLPAAAAALPEVVPGRGPRHREHPRRGRRAGRRQPLRHRRAWTR